MTPFARGKILKGDARVIEAAILDGELGLGHQARRLQALVGMIPQPCRPLRDTRDVAHGVGGAPSGQGQQARCRIVGGNLLRSAQRMSVAPFLKQAPGIAQGAGRLVLLSAPTELGHGARQGQGMADGPRQQVDYENSASPQHQEQVERNLRAPGRQHQQHVAFVVARGKRQADRHHGQHQQPEQGAHALATLRWRRDVRAPA
jgi:hypothetical protein